MGIGLNHLVDFTDMTVIDWEKLLAIANEIYDNPEKYKSCCQGKILATLFYEPSTRTQFSFQAAMLRLGGSVIGFADANSSSVSKGETLIDTIKIVSAYSDIIAIRHPVEGAAKAASLYSSVPVVNAGDGRHLHPTQTLTDLFTISKLKGTLTGHNIGLCGDLKNGRTVHSLIKAFTKFSGNKFYLISTNELQIPDYIYEVMEKFNIPYEKVNAITDCIDKLDILYMTRIQRERFESVEEYNKQAGVFVLDTEKLKNAKSDLIILHPLPKVDEIEYNVDNDTRAKYFKQAELGMYIRMALIYSMISPDKLTLKLETSNSEHVCKNSHCITAFEKNLPQLFTDINGKAVCEYCEHSV